MEDDRNMDIKDVIKLIEVLDKSDLRYLKLNQGEEKIILSKDSNPADGDFVESKDQSSNAKIDIADTNDINENEVVTTDDEANSAKSSRALSEVTIPSATQSNSVDLKIVKAPLMGTFYSAPSPDAKPFVSIGDKVKSGDVLCILEAMKMLNEISSEFDGEIVEILVNNEDLVEYNQPMFKIRPL